jgi:hypothetical protein
VRSLQWRGQKAKFVHNAVGHIVRCGHNCCTNLVVLVKKSGNILGGGIRKAYASKGDDTTLSRFVKVPGERPVYSKPTQGWLKGTRFNVSVIGRSVFYRKGVKPAGKSPMVSGHSNVKIGRDVRKGKLFRGYWIFTLTLEERATCPRTCFHWETCYGNNMPFAKRIDHKDFVALTKAIDEQISWETRKRNRPGILVRLHALGDFFSVEYVQFWRQMLLQYPTLACFGYTALKPWDEIGMAILALKKEFGFRFAIRWSDGFGATEDAAVPISHEKDCPPNAFICPEQTGATRACATCGLCWNTTKNVAFLEH